VFDLGGGSLDVSIINIEEGILEVISAAGSTSLGGNEIEQRMVSYFVEMFKQKHGRDISQNKKALCRLRAACERAKRSLSLSSHANIEIDSLDEGVDFFASITREKFEQLKRGRIRFDGKRSGKSFATRSLGQNSN